MLRSRVVGVALSNRLTPEDHTVVEGGLAGGVELGDPGVESLDVGGEPGLDDGGVAEGDERDEVLGRFWCDEVRGGGLGRLHRRTLHRARDVDDQDDADRFLGSPSGSTLEVGDRLAVDRHHELGRVRGRGQVAELDHHRSSGRLRRSASR